jgi:hypothetical protein
MSTASAIIPRMHALSDEWENRQDRRAIFLRCYSMMTANMLQAIDEGRFEDREWVDRLMHRFADYYFDALACYDCGEDVPEVWKDVHESAARHDLHVLQHLLLGVNAHINYDLVLTLHEMLRDEWATLSPEGRERRYRDHRLVNTIIGETIDKVQDEVVEKYAPMMDLVDRLLGRLDEKLLLQLITRWRENVWAHSQQLLRCESEQAREQYRRQVEAEVLKHARWLEGDFF